MADPGANAALGVFETLLVVDGRPVELAAHLKRIDTSLAEVFGVRLPAECERLASEVSSGLALGRLRLTVRPEAERPACAADAEPIDPAILFPPREQGPELRSHTLAGGLGGHKWVDRSALPTVSGPSALLLDRDGTVLETACANVFAVNRGVLLTPPLDSRILPGVTREVTIALAAEAGIETRQRRLSHADLLEADEAFLTGSVRGIEPARSLDGEALAAGGELIRMLSARLRRRWGV